MKKQLLVAAFAVICSISAAFAQPGQMQTPEERTTSAIEKMAPLTLKAEQVDKVKAALSTFYTAQQKAFEDMRASGNMDREAMKAKSEELSKQRDIELKAILTPEQYTKWVDEIAPTLRQRRQKQ